MAWLWLHSKALCLMEGATIQKNVGIQQSDADTYVLDLPLDWLRTDDAPRQLVISFRSFSEPIASEPGWKAVYAGIEQEGAPIPQIALPNPTLGGNEPLGRVVDFEGLKWVQGKVSWFGGSGDTTLVDNDTAALTCEPLRSLNAPNDYYCAMRWSFEPNGRRFWANRRILLLNGANRKAVVARAVDWGPAVRSGRMIQVSRNTLEALGSAVDSEILVAFAQPGDRPLGPLA